MDSQCLAEPLLDERETARLLNINFRTLQAWRLKGGGPRYIKVGRMVRYSRADVEAWLQGQSREHSSQGA